MYAISLLGPACALALAAANAEAPDLQRIRHALKLADYATNGGPPDCDPLDVAAAEVRPLVPPAAGTCPLTSAATRDLLEKEKSCRAECHRVLHDLRAYRAEARRHGGAVPRSLARFQKKRAAADAHVHASGPAKEIAPDAAELRQPACSAANERRLVLAKYEFAILAKIYAGMRGSVDTLSDSEPADAP